MLGFHLAANPFLVVDPIDGQTLAYLLTLPLPPAEEVGVEVGVVLEEVLRVGVGVGVGVEEVLRVGGCFKDAALVPLGRAQDMLMLR